MNDSTSDFDTYAQNHSLGRDSSSPFREDLVEPLFSCVFKWVMTKAVTTKPIRPLQLVFKSTRLPRQVLSEDGFRFCLQNDVVAATPDELADAFVQEPRYLLLFVNWRTLEFGQKLFKSIDSGQWPSNVHPDKWVRHGLTEFAGELDQYFEDARFVWMIDLDKGGLVRRVSAEAQATYAAAVAPDDVAATYLKKAWQAAFGIEPDPESAFLSAVKAIEAAFRPTISPANDRATAGIMADNLEQKPEKWQALLPDLRPASAQPKGDVAGVNFLASALRLLYQCRRAHGDDQKYDANTFEDAQAACFLASSLIAMQRNGFLTQREGE